MILHFIFVVKEEDQQKRKFEFEYIQKMESKGIPLDGMLKDLNRLNQKDEEYFKQIDPV